MRKEGYSLCNADCNWGTNASNSSSFAASITSSGRMVFLFARAAFSFALISRNMSNDELAYSSDEISEESNVNRDITFFHAWDLRDPNLLRADIIYKGRSALRYCLQRLFLNLCVCRQYTL